MGVWTVVKERSKKGGYDLALEVVLLLYCTMLLLEYALVTYIVPILMSLS